MSEDAGAEAGLDQGTMGTSGSGAEADGHSLLPHLQPAGLQGKQVPKPGQGVKLTRPRTTCRGPHVYTVNQ